MGLLVYYLFTVATAAPFGMFVVGVFGATGRWLARRSMTQTVLISLAIPIFCFLLGFGVVAWGDGGSGPEYGPGYGIGETIVLVISIVFGVLSGLLVFLSRWSLRAAAIPATLLASWAWTELGIELYKLFGLLLPDVLKTMLFGQPFMDVGWFRPFDGWLTALLAAAVCLITVNRASGQPLFGQYSTDHKQPPDH